MKIIKIIPIILAVVIIASASDANNTKFWKDSNIILNKAIKLYHGLKKSNIKWNTIGRSNLNNRIYYKQFGSGDKLILIIGGMHGDEPAGFISALKLAQFIKKNPALIHNRIIIVPCINPDGLLKGTRVNARGVDINRNFPGETWSNDFTKSYNNPGTHPASESETAALIKLMEKYKPDMIIQLHQPFNALYPSSNAPVELMNKMSELSELPVIDDIGYPTPGSLGNYRASQDYEIIGITLELCAINIEPEYNKIVAALFSAINYYDTATP
jgi:protein MpaA